MSQFLDTLKERFADAQRRLQLATTRLQQVQAEHQAVTQEFGSWQNAINVETRREQLQEVQKQILEVQKQQEDRALRSRTIVAPANAPAPNVSTSLPPAAAAPISPQSEPQPEPGSKTDIIRDVLRHHPEGITPVDVWKEVKNHVGRNYVYSVLKRLKDKKQVSERRGKYYLLQVTPKAEEDKDNSMVN